MDNSSEKLKVCGIIAEFNPFHNGHAFLIQEARKITGCDAVIIVMSGNFVQRGEPAVTDKWTRAEFAVKNGADAVIELPFAYSVQSASQFARGGVSLLKAAGADWIAFGSECGNPENLKEIAETPTDPDHLRISLREGLSFPKAYSLLTGSMLPNDILAVSYLKAIGDAPITPVVIQRQGSYTDDNLGSFASAYAIRRALKEKREIGESTPMHDILMDSPLLFPEMYYPYLRTLLLTTPKEKLRDIFLVSEGIESHLIRQAESCSSYDSFIRASTTYRYTSSRIRRTILQIMTQTTKEEVRNLPAPDTLRILAVNDTGRKWLASLRGSEVRTACRFSQIPLPYRLMESRAAYLYASVLPEEQRKTILDNEIRGTHYVPSL
ncbi:MAG: nucleotidyltransferase family protein [Solobacterium sp.]|nr:nucleotidyltransferase family protein [Solobacterium sp.]